MPESDGRVEYEVRADLSKIDADMAEAGKKVSKAAQKGAKKQEEVVEKAQENISQAVKKANDEIENDNSKTQKNITDTAKKQSDKVVQTEKKNKEAVTQTAKKEGDKVVDNYKKDTQEIINSTDTLSSEVEKKTSGIGSKIGTGLKGVGKGIGVAVGAGLAAAGTVAVAATGKAISAANELDKANNQLTASLSLTAEEAEKYGDIIKKVYGDNYGENNPDVPSKFNYGQKIWQWGTEIVDDREVDSNICFVDYPSLTSKWYKEHGGKTNDSVKTDTKSENKTSYFKPGDKVKVKSGAFFSNGIKPISAVYTTEFVIQRLSKDGTEACIGIDVLDTGWMFCKDLILSTNVVQENKPTSDSSIIKAGDIVRIKSGSKTYDGTNIDDWVYYKRFYVSSVNGNRVVLDKSPDSTVLAINTAFNITDLKKV